MKRSTRRKPTATQARLAELAKRTMSLRLHGQPVSQEMETEYRQLLAKNYAEMRKETV